MVPVVEILGFTLPIEPIFVLLAFYMGSELGAQALRSWAPASGDDWAKAFGSATLIGFVVMLMGARLAYAVTRADLYMAEPGLLLSLHPTALAIGPGLILGILAALWMLQRRGVPLTRSADAAAITAACALTILSLGDFFSGDAYGLPTQMPWAVEMWGASRHPVQLYVAVALLAVTAWLWMQRRAGSAGQTFWRFVALYSLCLLVFDGFRADSPTWLGFRTIQIAALMTALAAMYVLRSYGRLVAVSEPGPTQ